MGVFRLALAWSVLLGHTGGRGFFGLAFMDRQIAVQSFFVISGFYMALVLNEKYIGPGRYWTFVQQRFLRLYPTYLIILFAALFIDGTLYLATGIPVGSLKVWSENIQVMTPSVVGLFISANLILLGQDLVALLQFDPGSGHLGFFGSAATPFVPGVHFFLNPPSWSLGVELAFYLIAPFIVCRSAGTQVLVLLASLAFRCFLYGELGLDTTWAYNFFPPNVYFFIGGSLGYLFYRQYRARIETVVVSHTWIFYLFGFVVVAYDRLPFAHQLYVVFTPLVFLMVPLLFAATRNNRRDRLIGELSYPFYLIHVHVLLITQLLFAKRALWIYGPTNVAVTMLFSYLFYRYIETRTEHFREGLYQRGKAGLATGVRTAA